MWRELESMPVLEEGAFPVPTGSVQLSLKKNLKQPPDARKSRNSGLERLLHGASLGAAILETARGLEGYREGSVSQKGCREKEEEMGEISLPASLPSLQRGLAVPTQTFQLANQTQLLPRAENQRLAARRPPRQELGCCLSLLSLLPQHSPGLPSITHPAGRSGVASLTCLRFLRSPLFSRVHCFLSCMFQPCGNKTHGWLATRAGQMKQTLSLPLWQRGGPVASSIACRCGPGARCSWLAWLPPDPGEKGCGCGWTVRCDGPGFAEGWES